MYLDLGVVLGGAEDQSADASEAIDTHAERSIADGGGGECGL